LNVGAYPCGRPNVGGGNFSPLQDFLTKIFTLAVSFPILNLREIR